MTMDNPATANIKGDLSPETTADSTGVFCMKWQMCYPKYQEFYICGFNLSMPLCTGDTIDIEMDYLKAQQLKDDAKRMYQEAVTVSGASLGVSPAYRVLYGKLHMEAHDFSNEYLNKACHAGFNGYRQMEWEKHLKRLKEIKASKLNRNEKELLQLVMENDYITSLYDYAMLMEYSGCDSTEIATVQKQFTIVDPHASSLMFPKSINNAYIFNSGHIEYLAANGLDNMPLTLYLKERKKAEDLVAEIKALRDVSSNDIEGLPYEFRQPLYELKDELTAKPQKNDDRLPTCSHDTWLQQIVDRHKGHIVYIDYWATWCGPCQKGISEMAKVKDEYEKRGVDFVYITDNSSSADGFLDMKNKHKGDHFLFTNKDTLVSR